MCVLTYVRTYVQCILLLPAKLEEKEGGNNRPLEGGRRRKRRVKL